jgi:NTP pyrophosphatase (non-canonical NTP hydrolase)
MEYGCNIKPLTEIQLHNIFIEYKRASNLFPSFHSPHEGYAVIKEELDELWDEIRNGEDKENMKKEAIQVAAMALRFIIDVCNRE